MTSTGFLYIKNVLIVIAIISKRLPNYLHVKTMRGLNINVRSPLNWVP